jgi:hypothetical protein
LFPGLYIVIKGSLGLLFQFFVIGVAKQRVDYAVAYAVQFLPVLIQGREQIAS